MPNRPGRRYNEGRRATIGIGAGEEGVAADIGGLKIPGFDKERYEMTEAEKALPYEQQPAPYKKPGFFRKLLGDHADEYNEADRQAKEKVRGELRLQEAQHENQAKLFADTVRATKALLIQQGMPEDKATAQALLAGTAELSKQDIINKNVAATAANTAANTETENLLRMPRVNSMEAGTRATNSATARAEGLYPAQLRNLDLGNDYQGKVNQYYGPKTEADIAHTQAGTAVLNEELETPRAVGDMIYGIPKKPLWRAPMNLGTTPDGRPLTTSTIVKPPVTLPKELPIAPRQFPVQEPEPTGEAVTPSPLTPPMVQPTDLRAVKANALLNNAIRNPAVRAAWLRQLTPQEGF